MAYTLSEPCLKCRYIAVIVILDFFIADWVSYSLERSLQKKQCCKLHRYVRSQAYCYVPPQTLMKVSCES